VILGEGKSRLLQISVVSEISGEIFLLGNLAEATSVAGLSPNRAYVTFCEVENL
jgi:hypothetical protein